MSWTHQYPGDTLNPRLPTGLVYCGVGGPDRPASVEPFLHNLLSDPALVPLPAPLARLVRSLIVRSRAELVQERYATISPSGGSPQLGWSRQQCSQLEFLLGEMGLNAYASPAMHYWHPFPADTVREFLARGVQQYIVVSAFPQYSAVTSGGILTAVEKALQRLAPNSKRYFLADWHLLPGYLDTLARQAEPVIAGWHAAEYSPDSCALLFAALGLPRRLVRRGDPYCDQTHATVAAVQLLLSARLAHLGNWWQQLLGASEPLLAFQGKMGPMRWLTPDLIGQTRRLAAAGCRRLLVLPISFTSENIATLYELDVKLSQVAGAAGITEYHRGAALNLDTSWLSSLVEYLATNAFPGPWREAAAQG